MRKLLVANRSEIAIRCFRAATELGLRTVAVYSHEDRFSLHRFKADEAFLIGPPQGGEPVRSYLNIEAIIVAAREQGVDAIHPGYGFLSENAAFARACEAAGIQFVGPTPDHLEAFGDKTAAKRLAMTAGVPTIPGTEHALTDPAEVAAEAARIGYPLMIKASFGGGGRGMRVVHSADELLPKLAEAQREAGAAFGRPDVFLERYIARAKHIEVQILGDAHGNLVHLWERDCSVQRRHQKVVEVAPSIGLDEGLRRRICESAAALCRSVGYRSAGTVEFLLDLDRDEFYFIEVNPRIQVEHTVTEMVTGIDLVRSQILVASGHRLHEPPLGIPPQDKVEHRGVAMQCRVTTEDPERNFMPDYGRITTYRSAGGFAVRLDGGNGFGGAVITPYFDSLLVKVTTWGSTLEEAVQRSDRALREFRIRGVKTNIAFLLNLIEHPTFKSGNATTTFIDDTPELFRFRQNRDRATKMLSYLGDVIVNGRPDVKARFEPGRRLTPPAAPPVPRGDAPPAGTRQKLHELGPEKFAEWVRNERRLLLTDTTLRDAHQSLLATRVRTYDMLAVADAIARLTPTLFSLEMWGGATFDTSMRFLQEDPWQRLAELRQRIPNILFQMLLRASNAVGYTTYPDNVVRAFIKRERGPGDRRLPDLRLAELDRQHAAGDRIGAQRHVGDLRGRDLLHRRHPRPGPHEVLAEVLRPPGQGARRDGHAHPRHQGHGRAVQAVRGLRAGEGAARRGRRADPLPHARHQRHQLGQHPPGGRCGRRHRRRGAGVDERHDQPAVSERHRRGLAQHGARHRPRSDRRSTTSAATGPPSASCTTRSRRASRRRGLTSTSTRCRAGSTRISGSRRRASASRRAGPKSARLTPPPTSSSATSSRSRRRARSSAIWRCFSSPTSSRPTTC